MALLVLIALVLELNRDEWFIAILFGLVIDIDHAFAVPEYVANNGWAAILRATWDDGSGLVWKSVFHTPSGFFIAAPLAIGWRYLTPLLFWGVHVATDEFQLATLEYSAIIEAVFLSAVCGGVAAVHYRRWIALNPDAGLRAYLSHLQDSSRSYLRTLRPLSGRRGGST